MFSGYPGSNNILHLDSLTIKNIKELTNTINALSLGNII